MHKNFKTIKNIWLWRVENTSQKITIASAIVSVEIGNLYAWKE